MRYVIRGGSGRHRLSARSATRATVRGARMRCSRIWAKHQQRSRLRRQHADAPRQPVRASPCSTRDKLASSCRNNSSQKHCQRQPKSGLILWCSTAMTVTTTASSSSPASSSSTAVSCEAFWSIAFLPSTAAIVITPVCSQAHRCSVHTVG